MNVSMERVRVESSAAHSSGSKAKKNSSGNNSQQNSKRKLDVYNNCSFARPDITLVQPIRQTASIFKQPVTIYRNFDNDVKSDIKGVGNQDKPKQLLWEKRLEKLRSCDSSGNEFCVVQLPRGLKSIGPHVGCDETVIKSVATALHLNSKPVLGQTGSKTTLERNPSVFLDPKQPLMHAISISEDDIRRQEEKVFTARKKLEEALRND